MKILVIDDTELQREAAKAQLKAHELTIVSGYDAARKLLDPYSYFADWAATQSAVKGFANLSDEKQKKRWKAWKAPFDVVLTDLLMPCGENGILSEPEKFAGDIMPVGLFLALLAANRGVKFVSVVSNTGHHNHPAGTALDRLARSGTLRTHGGYMSFAHCHNAYVWKKDLAERVEKSAQVSYRSDPAMRTETTTYADGSKEVLTYAERERRGAYRKEHAVYVKAWDTVLDQLLAHVRTRKK